MGANRSSEALAAWRQTVNGLDVDCQRIDGPAAGSSRFDGISGLVPGLHLSPAVSDDLLRIVMIGVLLLSGALLAVAG